MPSRPVFDRPVAHRGLHDRAAGVIENSASAFAAAIAAGFSIECDLQLTSDGIPVIFHDDATERLLGKPGFVRDYTAAEFTSFPLLGSANGDTPQRFSEFLAQIAGRALLQVELKKQRDADTARLARAAAQGLKSYTGPVTVESFDPRLLAAIRSEGYSGPLGIITYGYDNPDWENNLSTSQKFVLRHLLHAPWSRFTFISCYQNALDLPAVRLFRTMGIPVTAWTIRSAEEARAVRHRADQIVFEGFDPATIS